MARLGEELSTASLLCSPLGQITYHEKQLTILKGTEIFFSVVSKCSQNWVVQAQADRLGENFRRASFLCSWRNRWAPSEQKNKNKTQHVLHSPEPRRCTYQPDSFGSNIHKYQTRGGPTKTMLHQCTISCNNVFSTLGIQLMQKRI